MIPNKCTIKDYKALLREADEEIEAREKHIRYLENKNQKLHEQLAIAVEALETINVCCDECSFRASYALHQIEELEK